jgi:hypothetical protein
MDFVGSKFGAGKADLLSSLDYCRFACHGDVPAAKLLHHVGERYVAGHASGTVYGFGYISGSRDEWMQGAGLTLAQFAKRAWPRLRCYPFIKGAQWLKGGKTAVWIELTAGLLPAPPAGAVDWKAHKKAAPWLHKLLPTSKSKKLAPAPMAVLLPSPVVASVPVEVPVVPPAKPPIPAPAKKPKKAPPKYVVKSPLMIGLKAGAPMATLQALTKPKPKPKPAPAPVAASEPPAVIASASPVPAPTAPKVSPHPGGALAALKAGTTSAPATASKPVTGKMPPPPKRTSGDVGEGWIVWAFRAQYCLDNLGNGRSFIHVLYAMEQMYAHLRKQPHTRDLWLLNLWTYEDDAATAAFIADENSTDEYPADYYEKGFAWKPGMPYVKPPTVKVPSKTHFKYNPPPKPDALLARLREAALAAGYRDKLAPEPAPAKTGTTCI